MMTIDWDSIYTKLMSSTTADFQYTGHNELVVMELAKNYNGSILGAMLKTYYSLKNPTLTLDFGAGNGWFADSFTKGSHCKTACIEPDENLRSEIVKRNQNLLTYSNLGDLNQQQADFIYSLNVLEHIEDDLQALTELRKTLKQDGRIYIYVPAFMLLFSSNDRLVGHFRRYRMAELKNKMEQAGFKILSARYTDHIGFFAALVYKWFLDKGTGEIGRNSILFFDKFLFPLNTLLAPFLKSLFGKNIEVIASPKDGADAQMQSK